MARSTEQFRLLLNEAVHSIHTTEDKPISLIHEELGFILGKQPTAVEHWRKGNIPAKYADVEKLAEEIVRRTRLGQDWLEKFFSSAGYHCPHELLSKLPQKAHTSTSGTKLTIPVFGPSQQTIVGRDKVIEKMVTVLHGQSSPWVIAIDGMGGIGKTALAYGVAEKCISEQYFDVLISVGLSEQQNLTEVSETMHLSTYEAILNSVAAQLGDIEASKLKIAEKQEKIRKLLRNQRALIVIDNLEIAQTSQNEVGDRLLSLIAPSKAILISRHRFSGDFYPIRLTGLDEEASIRFIRHMLIHRGTPFLQTASLESLSEIATVTGGSPLALKLVIGQLAHLEIKVVLNHLRTVQPIKSDYEKDDYVNFYKSIFWPSWRILSNNSRSLLIAMSNFVPGEGGVLDMIQSVSGFSNNRLINSIDQLWEMSLIEVGESSSLNRMRYYLHALTRHFVLSDIVKTLPEKATGALQNED